LRTIALREEPRLRVFENRMLRGIYKRDELTGVCIELHKEHCMGF
jgi:hypothetical protein